MKFYYFPPWRKQFFFSSSLFKSLDKVNLFYAPYSTITKIFFNLWFNSRFFRFFFKIKLQDLNLPAQLIDYFILNRFTDFQINLGTKGLDNKITILCYRDLKLIQFVKVGVTNNSISLIRNEMNTLNLLNSLIKTPVVLNFYEDNSYFLLATSAFEYKKFDSYKLNKEILSVLFKLNSIHISSNELGLKLSICHGDFTPWNILYNDLLDEYLLVDWEFSHIAPLGTDLYTFIFRVEKHLFNNLNITSVLLKYKYWIELYFEFFQIKDYFIYQNYFILNYLPKFK